MTGRSERLRGKRTMSVRSRRAARAPPDPLLEILYISPRGIRTLRCTTLSPRNFLSVAFLNGGGEVALYAGNSRKLAGEPSFLPEECILDRSRSTIASYECSSSLKSALDESIHKKDTYCTL